MTSGLIQKIQPLAVISLAIFDQADNIGAMISRGFQIFGIFLALCALILFWADVRNNDAPAKLLGQLWYDAAPQSLQLAEAITERYIDPCGLLGFLGCDTFLWHPVIATLLGWPAGLVFGLFAAIILLITSFSIKRGRKSVKSLKMDGR